MQSAHNNADGNSSLEAFSADIAHHNQHAAVLFRPDAEEIPAHLFSRCIGALDPEPQNILVRCNQLLLHLACGFQLDTQFVAGATPSEETPPRRNPPAEAIFGAGAWEPAADRKEIWLRPQNSWCDRKKMLSDDMKSAAFLLYRTSGHHRLAVPLRIG